MDMKDLLSKSMAKQIGKAVGVDDDTVGALLQQAVPALLDNMSSNAKKKDGAAALQKALLAHADDDDDVAKIDKAFEQLEKATEKPDVSGLLEALKYVNATISEVDKIKVNLLGIKAQIQKFIK